MRKEQTCRIQGGNAGTYSSDRGLLISREFKCHRQVKKTLNFSDGNS